MSQIILITGTRKGIGKIISEYYLSKGEIVIGCSRREGSIEHSNYRHIKVDVSDEKAVVSMVRKVAKEFGGVDVLINNAGIASMNHFLLTPFYTMEKVIRTNVFGTMLFSREVSKVMMKNKKGRIINYSTVAVPLNLEGEAVYAASKSAVESLTKVTAKELVEYGITVNAIGPTPIATDLIKNVPNKKIEELIEKQTIKRLGEVTDIINVLDFFMKEESRFITGQIIYLGGIN